MPVSRSLKVGRRGFSLPVDMVTRTMGILAVKRAGKSNAAVVMAEEMFDAGVPWVAIDPKGDWWGIKAQGTHNSPGLPVIVFGGEHGDVPLDRASGVLVADLIAEERITCVLDVSDFASKADQRRFLTDFAQRLYKANREPLHVFCEEADEYIPQRVGRDETKVVSAFETLVKRGGFRGIGVTLVTQRSASLNKDVLTQVGTLFVLRTTGPQDRKAIRDWTDWHDAGSDLILELPKLANGEAYVFSPEDLGKVERLHFRSRRTYDSGATPEVGKKIKPPARLADVDLEGIREAMASLIEHAEATDPKRLQTKIRGLEKELEGAHREIDRLNSERPEPEIVVQEVKVIPTEAIEVLKDIAKALAEAEGVEGIATISHLKIRREDVDHRVDPVAVAREEMMRSTRTPLRTSKPALVSVGSSPAPTKPAGRRDVDGMKFGKTERAVMTVLAVHGPSTHSQVCMLAGYSTKASTVGVAVSKLRKAGFMEDGQPLTATPEGLDWLGDYESLPTGPELLEYWRGRFGKTERAVLDVLVEAYPIGLNARDTAVMAGYSPDASTAGVAASKLRKVGVLDGWRLSDDFARAAGIV